MEIREDEKFYIIAPLSGKLDKRETERIAAEIMGENRIIGLDLSYTIDCTIDFIEDLKDLCKRKSISIFNIPSDLFAVFNFFDLDKSAKIFVSEPDFEENARQIINRKFALV